MRFPTPPFSRRAFLRSGLALTGLGLLAGCGVLPPSFSGAAKVPRIGYIGMTSSGARNADELAAGLRELGYVEGQNVIIEWRLTEGRLERDRVAAELVAAKVDVIVATGVFGAQAAQQATRTIPIVIVMLSDPVEGGFVASYARPGGNITGLGSFQLELSRKQLELLREAVPSVTREGVLWERSHPGRARQFKEIQDTAPALSLDVASQAVGDPTELANAIRDASQSRVDAIFVLQSDLTVAQQPRIIELVAQARLPAMYVIRDWVEAGGLMSYGPSFPAMHRRAAYYVDKVLKGTAPADLPVERPREFEFVMNLRTAHSLGLNIPPSVLAQAGEVIQ